MSILFAGSSLADFTTANGPLASTVLANLGPTVLEGVAMGGTTQRTISCDFAASTDVWLAYHHRVLSTTSATAVNCVEFFSTAYSTVNALFRIRRPNATTWRLEYFNGSAFVTTEATWANGPGADTALHRFDVRLSLSNTVGVFSVFRDGVLVATFSLTDTIYTTATTIDRISIYAGGYISSATDSFVSAVIVADEDTRSLSLSQMLPSGAGGVSEWTGTFASVDETGIDDADFIESLTSNQNITFNFADLPTAVAGQAVEAVIVSGRGRVGTTAPTGIAVAARIGATNFEATLTKPAVTAYGPFQAVLAFNPATTTPWTQTQVNAAEFGVKSKT